MGQERRHHVVPRWLLRQFCDPQDRIYALDIRRRRVERAGRSVDGVGWIPHFYSTGAPGARDTAVERWLSRTSDELGHAFLRNLRAGALTTEAERHDAARMVMALRLRTIRGMEVIRETWTEDETPEDDDLRRAFPKLVDLADRDEEPWLIANTRWTLVEPPAGRCFPISDCAVTSRLGDPPSTAAGPAEMSLPINPGHCLLVTQGDAGVGPARAIGSLHYLAIVRRTMLAADRWVWAHDRETLERALDDLVTNELEPIYPAVGRWPGATNGPRVTPP